VRIALDVHVLTGPPQGTVSVWETLLPALPADHEYVLLSFDPAETRRRYPQPWFEHQAIPLHFAPARIALAYPLLARRLGCDVLHVNYFGPPAGAPGLVVSMHDVLYLDFPGLVPAARRAQFRVLAGLTARRAARVQVGSAYSRNRIVHHFGVEADRIDFVPYALRREWLAPDEASIESAWSTLAAGLPARYALSVGRLEPRKNHIAAVRAASRLRREGLLDGLVLVGAEDFGGPAFRDAIRAEGLADAVVHLPRVALAELQALFRHASLMLYLSLAEGFGLPVLEAMAMGVPLVATDRTAVPEVCGDAALLVDPEEPEVVLAAARRLLTDLSLAASMREAGTRRAAEFTPARTAARTIESYARAIR
jgi:glycosyltransferase involved in cell wall biosynthesis